MLLFGYGSSFAQQVGSLSTRNAPAMPTAAPAAVPGTIPTVGPGRGNALGTIQLNPGASPSLPGSAMGTIMTCPTTGVAAAAPSTIFDASSGVGDTGVMPAQPLPGASPLAISSLGTSVTSGTCNSAGSTQAAVEALGSATTIAPIPGLATITGATYSDATIPTAATEAGGAGLSPLIVVPAPAVVPVSP
jgi:hypothetical protein